MSLERLLKRIYIDGDYNNDLRPFGQSNNDITKIEMELKLLTIDLDEKYQQLYI